MIQGSSRVASAGPFAGLLALLLALWLAAPAPAAQRSAPPSAAEFQRATDRLLDGPAFRGSGGVGSAGPSAEASDLLFPDDLYLTFYGAPQLVNTELGKRSPRSAARRVVRQARPYERKGDEDVVAGFDLIGVVANSTPGPDRKYRTRQPDPVIATYLEQVRKFEGRLMLDIQPGRSSALREIVALQDWFAEADVDVGIDPEWNVGRKGVPGKTVGSVTAGEVNAASKRLNRIVEDEGLPPKVMIVHQFTKGMVKRREAIRQRDGVQVVLNFDGIGSSAAKEAGYAALATEGLFNGFSIFTTLDDRVMNPAAVLALLPAVDFLLYQ